MPLAPTLTPGTVLHGRYRVVEPLGRGGMATAYRADDLVAGEPVALKLLSGDEAPAGALRAEFALLTRLRHPRLAAVRDFGLGAAGSGLCYYTADLVVGAPLDAFAAGAPWSAVARPLADAVEALAFLHRAGVRHGDFAPRNVLVDGEGRGTLIDLGCARPLQVAAPAEVSGTPGFVAPEVLEGEAAGPRADLYAVGATIAALRPSLAEDAPEGVARLADRLLARDAGRRPADALEVIELIDPREGPVALSVAAPLLGRDAEVARAEALLGPFFEGRAGPRALWVTGPSGVGRSRLLAELKWTSQLRGPVFEGLRSERAPVSSLLARATGADAPRGLEAVLALLDRLRRDGAPTVLVLDDVHRLPPGEGARLDALRRSLEPEDPVLLLLAADVGPRQPLDVEAVLGLDPLGPAALERWAAGLVPGERVGQLHRLTGGLPALVERLLAALASGELREDELGSDRAARLAARQAPSVEGLSEEERRALALVAAAGGFADQALLGLLGVADEPLEALHRGLWVVAEAGGWRLWCAADGPSLLEGLGRSASSRLYGELAEATRRRLEALSVDDPARGELEARLVVELARASRPGEAARLLERSRGPALSARAWVEAAEAVAEASEEPADRLVAASTCMDAGAPDRALAALAPALALLEEPAARFRARLLAARCYLRLGDLRRCHRQLRRAAGEATSPTERALLGEQRARALIQKGDYKGAQEAARAVVAADLSGAALAALHEDLGVASSFLGEHELARDELRRAAELTASGERPQDRVRRLTYGAINEYRMGHARKAADGYAEALDLAERAGLGGETATAALNLGTACHQIGDLGRALECYERGLRTAVALGFETTALHLRLNLAQLHADIGSFDRAEAALARIGAGLSAHGWLAAAADSLAAQVAAGRGEVDGARELLLRARGGFAALGSSREVAEVDLELCELEWRLGELDAAGAALASAAEAAAGTTSPDLLARLGLAEGRLLTARGQGDAALRVLEEAGGRAAAAEQGALEAEVEAALVTACELRGATFLARRHGARGRELWERVAATLPAELRDVFWGHPRRAELPALRDEVEPSSTGPSKIMRLMEINRQLVSSLRTEDVLRHAMDAAIELSGAERGFVVLTRAGEGGEAELHVAVARNLDKEGLGRSHLKLSRGIAEEVLRTGEAVLTVDALHDDRFRDNLSVHAMRLRSVVCVPIRSADGVVGALYLDNRFQRARFREVDMSLLQAFADQAAIALRNARLVAELEGRTAELEAERRKVQALVESQAEEIERLSEEVEAIRPASRQHRHDFGRIVGRSAAMLGVLDVLERVIDAPWPVLIQGESGTGKELIARAVHESGPRRAGPFVSVNCAALPEPLLESELFGHVKGAFTGATRDRKGLFVEAGGGTLFLDEVGEMPLEMQAKLLRVLEEREVRPVGSEEVTAVDVRLVCATNRRLRDEVEARRFREDLFYRLAVMELWIPALRERAEDIPALATHLLAEAAREMGREPPLLTPRALRKLARHGWPGNVRQLRNVLAKALVLAEGEAVTPADIELPRAEPARREVRSRDEFERGEAARILAALAANRWNVAEVARSLGIPRSTLYRKLKRYGLGASPRGAG